MNKDDNINSNNNPYYGNNLYGNNYDNENNSEFSKDDSGNKYKYIIIGVLAIILIILLVIILGRGKNKDNYTMTIYPDEISLQVGSTQNVSCVVRNNNQIVSNATVNLSVADTQIAKVDNMVITGLKGGNTILKAVYITKDGKTVQELKNIEVIEVKKDSIEITSTITKINVGQIVTLTSFIDSFGSSTINWSSSDSSVLTVDANGTIQGIKAGKATVVVTTSNGGRDSIDIEVVGNEVTDIQFAITPPLILKVGESIILTPTIVPDTVTDKTLTYTPLDPNIVSVLVNPDFTANITGLAAGTTTIKVRAVNGFEKDVAVTVEKKNGGSSSGTSCSTKNKNAKCADGQYVECGKCIDCPAGSYCQNKEKHECPAGTGSLGKATSCSKCTGNTYSKNGICTVCQNGQKANSSHTGCDNSTSSSCPAGQFLVDSGSIAAGKVCAKCQGNTYTSSSNSATSCTPCPTGQVANLTHTGCINPGSLCGAGKGRTSSTAECSTCSAGTYSPANDNTCHQCPTGTYSLSGASTCLPCSSLTGNYYCNGRVMATCVSPKKPNASRTACVSSETLCGAGKGKTSSTAECSTCSAGTYSPANDNTCHQCSAGTYSLSGASSCLPCSSLTGNYYCYARLRKTCPAGKKANSTHTGCIDA